MKKEWEGGRGERENEMRLLHFYGKEPIREVSIYTKEKGKSIK